jgi:hypothetical protein
MPVLFINTRKHHQMHLPINPQVPNQEPLSPEEEDHQKICLHTTVKSPATRPDR